MTLPLPAGGADLAAATTVDEVDFEDRIRALESGTIVPTVVQFGGPGATRTAVNHSYHGVMWPTGVDLPAFQYDVWMCRLPGASEYVITEGYGGAHAILFDGTAGNIWDGSASTSFSSNYTPQAGEWFQASVGWDGAFYLYVWVNGICVGVANFLGPRRAQQGELFIGGSDHSNFFGKVAVVRGYEGSCPLANPGSPTVAFMPSRGLATISPVDVPGRPNAQFGVSYLGSPSSLLLPDLGVGYGGMLHHGILRDSSAGALNAAISGDAPIWVADATAPFGPSTVARTRIPASPAAVPSGAKIWDSCGRADSIPAFTEAPTVGGVVQTTPGSTEGGSLGPKVWQHITAAQRWGVFDGALAPMTAYSTPGGIYVLNDSADMDVSATRKNAQGWNAQLPGTASGNRGDIMLILRYQDATNFLYTYVYRDTFGANILRIYKKVANVDTQLAQWNLPNYTWTTMRWTLVGNTIQPYIDGASLGSPLTDATFNSAVGVGLLNWGLPGATVKATNFLVK